MVKPSNTGCPGGRAGDDLTADGETDAEVVAFLVGVGTGAMLFRRYSQLISNRSLLLIILIVARTVGQPHPCQHIYQFDAFRHSKKRSELKR